MKSRRTLIFGGLAILVVILYAGRQWLLPLPARWLDVGGQPRHSDCAFVLGGDASTRAVAAAVLVRRGWAAEVLVPRTVDHREPSQRIVPAEHELIRRVLLQRGVPNKAIHDLGRDINSTYDEARALARFLDNSPEKRVLVVTNSYHTRRTRWTFSRVLGTRATQVVFVSAPDDSFPAEGWWRSGKGAETIIGEYLKLAVYVLRYTSFLYGLAGAIVIFIAIRFLRARLGPHAFAAGH